MKIHKHHDARRAFAGAVALALTACVTQPAAPPLTLDAETAAAVAASAAAQTAADRLKADVDWLADDARQGREAGSQGYEAAARYVAGRFEALGLKPGGENGGWYQEVRLRKSTRNLDLSYMSLARKGGDPVELVNLEDYIVSTSPVESAQVIAPVVFAGYGVTDPSTDYDDYAGIDAQGKIVVLFSGGPVSMDSEKRAHFGGTGEKTKNAAAHGAVGVIFLATESSEKRYSWDRIIQYAGNASMTWVGPDGEPDVPAPSMKIGGFMSNAGAAKLFEGAKFSYEQLRADEADEKKPLPAFDLPVVVTMRGGATFEDVTSPNVAGMIEGADPALKHEVVVLSAHLDAVGMDKPKEDEPDADIIKNGALDNAIGVATLIEEARTFKETGVAPPRTILFLAVTAEEKGLLGADYFAHFPTVPKENIVADVNLDMPLVLFDFVDVVAFGAERSTLGEIVGEAANSMGVALSPDPMPDQGLFTRSDHYRFVEQGVPSVFLVVGFGNGGEAVFADFLKNNYHKPGDDTAQGIKYDAAARFAELNYRIAKAIADAPERPRWKESDFFGELFGE